MNDPTIGWIGGIIGGVLGCIGGIIGTYFSIKNVNGPRESFHGKVRRCGLDCNSRFLNSFKDHSAIVELLRKHGAKE